MSVKQQKPVARQENIWLLFEQVRLGHLMVEAASRVVEVLIGEQVNVDAALGFIHLGNLESNKNKNAMKNAWEKKDKRKGRRQVQQVQKNTDKEEQDQVLN